MNLAPEDDPVAASWRDVLPYRPPLPWQEELEKRVLSERVVSLQGPWNARKIALDHLQASLATDDLSKRVVLLGHDRGFARAWTYGRGVAESLYKVFKLYQEWTMRIPAVTGVAPLIVDTLEAGVAGHNVFLDNAAGGFARRYQRASREADEHHKIASETQDWLHEELPKPKTDDLPAAYVAHPFHFLRLAYDLKCVGSMHFAFDGLDSGGKFKLRSIEKLLSLAQDCGTPFTFVLGWSGSDDDFKRLASELPELATELKRSAFYLP